jgi:hypothetical protein
MKGGSIMKCKAVPGLLALIVTLVLSATAAQAGEGGLPSALTSFFACYSINGKDSGQTVDIVASDPDEVPIPTPARQNVRIGSGSLACTIIRMFVPPSAQSQYLAEPNPDPNQASGFNAIKCYTVTGPGGTFFPGPSGRFEFTDTIWGTLGTLVTLPDGSPGNPDTAGSLDTETNLTISQLKYICGPAIIFKPS